MIPFSAVIEYPPLRLSARIPLSQVVDQVRCGRRASASSDGLTVPLAFWEFPRRTRSLFPSHFVEKVGVHSINGPILSLHALHCLGQFPSLPCVQCLLDFPHCLLERRIEFQPKLLV